MMSEGKRDASAPPGRAFWQEAERKRNALGWTKTAMTRRAGIARKTYDRLLDQPKKPLPETINKIADVLGIPRPDAYALSGLDPSTAVVEEAASQEVTVEDGAADEALEELLARIPERRRLELERIRMEERERYKRLLAEAREEYERSLGRIERILRTELEEHDPEA